MGGVGYLDEPDEPEVNISRFYRDTAANMTWEGTTNVLSREMVRHLLKAGSLEIFSAWFEKHVWATIQYDGLRSALSRSRNALKSKTEDGCNELGAALADGRQIMFSLAWVVSGALLAHDAQRDANPPAFEVFERWILHGERGVGEFVFPAVAFVARQGVSARGVNLKERLNWDCRPVWGVDLPADAAMGYRVATKTSSGSPEQIVTKL